ncbi:hypothetical protein EU803_16660 [Loktanella sp. IMCC34160]|uniref:hypothetical protein n=1 Tax=Loktanella sp. IMCC34160 TaxID=2510646 RepID=UPI00101D49B4|nr:hypothetical protein [Loktanella sp. IMCC34160]RYG89782.1 hypothetical protein EU803_16660 [Loktanella sp. IMCC34160]
MSTQLEALVFVCTTSLSELKALTASLDDTDPRIIDARIRQIEACASTLSSGLDRLSKTLDDLPPETGVPNNGPQPPVDDGGLLLHAAQRLFEFLPNDN